MTTQPSLTELFCQNQQSVHTQTNAKYRLASFAKWLEAEYRVTDLEAVAVAHILAYKQHLASNGLQPTSQARALETLRSFFRWCHAEGLIDHDPAELVKSPRAVLNQEPDYLTTDESRKLFDAIDPNGRHAARDRAMAWALAVGLRVGEVVSLNVADVIPPAATSGMSVDMPPDLAKDTSSSTPNRGGLGLAGLRIHGKRSYERIIPLPHVAYTALADYLKERGHVALDAPLFACHYAGESDRRLTTRAVQKWFADLVTSAGLDTGKAHPHACRHGAAMRWLYQSNTPGGIYTVSRMLGHSSIQTTQRYLHVGPQGRAAMESAVMSDPLTA